MGLDVAGQNMYLLSGVDYVKFERMDEVRNTQPCGSQLWPPHLPFEPYPAGLTGA